MRSITVLTTTYRKQFIGWQFEALIHSPFQDFEWVLVDDNHDENLSMVRELAHQAKFPVIHCAPESIKPYFAKASALNDGLIRASGEYVYFMNDYEIIKDNCIGRHYEVQKRLGGVMLGGNYGGMIGPDPNGRMAAFIVGKFQWQELDDGLYQVKRDGAGFFYNGRNDSAPLKALLDCNGYDEWCDGAWGGEDMDMSQRLITYGLRCVMDTRSYCMELPHTSGEKPSIRSPEEQQAYQKVINERIAQGVYTANPHRNLREERCRLSGLA